MSQTEKQRIDTTFSLLGWVYHRDNINLDVDGDFFEVLRKQNIDSLVYLSQDKRSARQSLYDKVWHAQRACLIEVLDTMAANGISAIVFKGAELFEGAFASSAVGLMSDCDILVSPTYIAAAKMVMFRLGYRQAIFNGTTGRLVDRDVKDTAAIEYNHYELAPFSRVVAIDLTHDEIICAKERNRDPIWIVDNVPYVIAEFDIHHNVATDVEADYFFQRAVESSFGVAYTMSPTDHLWFITSRYYTEVALHGKTSLRDLVYLMCLLNENIDWQVIVQQAEKYSLHAALYYLFALADYLATGAVPSEVFEALNPRNTQRNGDWGWQLGKLFGFIEDFPWRGQ